MLLAYVVHGLYPPSLAQKWSRLTSSIRGRLLSRGSAISSLPVQLAAGALHLVQQPIHNLQVLVRSLPPVQNLQDPHDLTVVQSMFEGPPVDRNARVLCELVQVDSDQARCVRSPTGDQPRHVPARDADGRGSPVYRPDPQTGLHHEVGGVRITMHQGPGLADEVGDRIVEPPRHKMFEASELMMLGMPLKNFLCGMGDEAVEGRPVLTEAAERAQLLLLAVVRGVHPGQPSEGGQPGVDFAPAQLVVLTHVLQEQPVSALRFVAHRRIHRWCVEALICQQPAVYEHPSANVSIWSRLQPLEDDRELLTGVEG